MILVAGIGNIFFGDDGFGVEVSRRLATAGLPGDVRVVDFGIRGFDLTYALLEGYEAGVALRGTEVKSIREGNANLKDAYGLIKNGEAFLLNAHIGPYSHGNLSNHDAVRTRKLLLKRAELNKLEGKTQAKGHTLIPTRLYFRNGSVKCELAVAKGKQDWDKRETVKRREADREAKAAIVNSQRRAANG